MNNPQIQGIGMTSQRTRSRLVERLRSQNITDEKVLRAIGNAPRHLFIDEAMSHRAYEDTALPIGLGQTISQPFIVALMTQALLEATATIETDFRSGKILEIGTGCGYQSLILAQLFPQVFSIERIYALQKKATQRLRDLKVFNVNFLHGDGWNGWEGQGPYDAIIVTAAANSLPEKLIEQLIPGGSLVIPVGEPGQPHELYLYTKKDNSLTKKKMADVRFVPLISGPIEQ